MGKRRMEITDGEEIYMVHWSSMGVCYDGGGGRGAFVAMEEGRACYMIEEGWMFVAME